MLWLAAPLTGFIVQPIIGHYQRPHLEPLRPPAAVFPHRGDPRLAGAAGHAAFRALWMAAGLLWILDASVNVSMEPFRAFVADILPPAQRKVGFAMQSLFIGLGAVLSSALPWLLKNAGVKGEAAGSAIPLTVMVAFTTGAVVFFLAVLYTILTTGNTRPTTWRSSGG